MLGKVRFLCQKVGSHERLAQVKNLIRAIDSFSEGVKIRVHLTLEPGMDSKKEVEIRLQPLSIVKVEDEIEFIKRMKANWPKILNQGEKDGWQPV